ncbi:MULTISPECIES: tRNA preQ1(34) S-adenosylmethionine ribosyltransferase-isomerase QueA [Nosocomiicoccus]|uniref:tRNA preQ1(34) S-adenosylmethionine ribosyltransferase-isomerase QueA n=1 Tax=Nosocomiicoccus TaxID=489909 RepID=UPI000834FEC5|nr:MULTISPECIES: tRNA preQ1(34) S-adenosylmethionine ribosyltransferase-isomerase QueA [Nosocomiicoccus]OFL48146.1 S-adenosylmethionine:tRNA ribosyltransferase-isomerase [Nosocomiicoccus sp. HMSC067E10]OFS64097.1 tRNA preQ1(34) S-adenosylmethionine ribosyltransferase-isomerase QueA [Nosocomiicoccus sp. HMSC09A07]
MKLTDFDFHLPESLIAQHPLKNRTDSKLLVLDRETGEMEDRHFYNIIDYLKKDDVLVLNNTRVLPARLHGHKKDSGGHVEMLLLNPETNGYKVLIKPARRVHVGTEIVFGDGELTATPLEKHDNGIYIVKLQYDGILEEVLDGLGEMPLPPYIKAQLEDNERYQTVFSKHSGSAAAPTAGLHFTTELLSQIKEKGVDIVYITLHVGLGTFRPVAVENVEEHDMHSEFYSIEKSTAKRLNEAKEKGHRIISVGTTSTRTLEANFRTYKKFVATSDWTDIFIYPGQEILSVDGLITNFHLPKSTLLMLVSTVSTRENILKAYNHAVEKEYRFFSFGDAMLII